MPLRVKKWVADGGQRKKSPSSYNTSESESIVNATDISFEDTIPKNEFVLLIKTPPFYEVNSF